MELLIVIAIIGGLTLCVLAALPSARAALKSSQCTSRLRTISQAVLQYTQDNNDTMPAGTNATFGQEQGIWMNYRDLVTPYLAVDGAQQKALFFCPAAGTVPVSTGYFFNGANEYSPAFKGLAGKRVMGIGEPTRTLLLIEMPVVFSQSWHFGKGQAPHNNSRSYVSFADGHVALQRIFWSGQKINAGMNPPPEYGYRWGD